MASSIIQRQQIHKTIMMIIFSIPIFISLNVGYKIVNHAFFKGPEFPRTYSIVLAEGMIQKKTYDNTGRVYVYIDNKRHWVQQEVYDTYNVGQSIQLKESYNTLDGWDFLQCMIAAITAIGAFFLLIGQIIAFFEWYGRWLNGEV